MNLRRRAMNWMMVRHNQRVRGMRMRGMMNGNLNLGNVRNRDVSDKPRRRAFESDVNLLEPLEALNRKDDAGLFRIQKRIGDGIRDRAADE